MSEEKPKPEAQKGNPVIMFAVLVVFGLVLGGIGIYRYNLGKRSVSWPAATGVITASRAQPTKTENNRNEYRLSVGYTYAVDGKTYSGTRITASDVYEKTRNAAEEALKKYPIGGEVSVYYDPDDPGSSLLETGMKKNVYALLGGSAFCFLLAAAIVVSEVKKRLGHPSAPPGSAGAPG
jgi:Protein of unknown function (DUF3592)